MDSRSPDAITEVKSRIERLIEDMSFECSFQELRNIHNALFDGIIKDSGVIRTSNIKKKQWILVDDSVKYCKARLIDESIARAFEKESNFDYSNISEEEFVKHIAQFVSEIWQIHPFREGNTRAVTVFLIRYLKTKGFKITNAKFCEHSSYFRNALVRSQYELDQHGVFKTYEPLERFLKYVILDIPAAPRPSYFRVHDLRINLRN